MSRDHQQFGFIAATELRIKTSAVRLALMAVIAALLWGVGHWTWAPLWYGAYVVLQAIAYGVDTVWRDHDDVRRERLVCLLAASNFTVAGLPVGYMWTHCGGLGLAAGVLYLCGMLTQMVVGSLGARRLFWWSATPLAAYLLILPPFTFANRTPDDAPVVMVCVLCLLTYLFVLWAGHQRVLEKMEAARLTAVKSRLEAEAANKAKSEFLAVMSHEVRTPMNAVLGAAELLRRGELDEAQSEQVKMIADAGAVLMHVLNDILDMSKIEAGKIEIDPVNADLHELIATCAAMWETRAWDKGLSFDVEVAADIPRFVVVDASRVSQILFNLFSNAIKFTSLGGVSVRVRAESVGGDAYSLEFAVADTGTGIPPEAMERLFAAFQQADQSIARRFGGTGLGLAISQRLAQLLGGSIRVESAVNQGATFTLALPVKAGQAPEAATAIGATPEAVAAPKRRLRILVAEDHPANRRIVEMFLAPLGASLTLVNDGRQALDTLATAIFDLVLMDVQMPEVDGLEATRRLRASSGPNARIPVLALTANVMEDQQRACREAGMDGHIAKPIDAQQLISTVLLALDGQNAAENDGECEAEAGFTLAKSATGAAD